MEHIDHRPARGHRHRAGRAAGQHRRHGPGSGRGHPARRRRLSAMTGRGTAPWPYPTQGLPAPGAYPRGRRPGRPAEREGGRADRGQGGVHPPARRAGLTTIEATSFVHPEWVPQLADAERAVPAARPAQRPGVRAARCSCPTSAVSTARCELGARRDRGLRQRHRVLRPGAISTGRWTSRSRCSSRWSRGPRAAGRARSAATCRCASATRGRARCRSSRWSAVAKRLLDLGCDELSLGDTIGVAHPRPRAGPAAPRSTRPASRTDVDRACTSTTPTARPWPTPWPPSSTA